MSKFRLNVWVLTDKKGAEYFDKLGMKPSNRERCLPTGVVCLHAVMDDHSAYDGRWNKEKGDVDLPVPSDIAAYGEIEIEGADRENIVATKEAFVHFRGANAMVMVQRDGDSFRQRVCCPERVLVEVDQFGDINDSWLSNTKKFFEMLLEARAALGMEVRVTA